MMTAWKAVGWWYLAVGCGIVAFLLSGPPWAPRPVAPAPEVSIARGMDPGRPPTPKGRCWLAPSRVRSMRGTIQEQQAECAMSSYGCVFDSSALRLCLLEEPLRVQCVADGHGRKTR